MAYFARVLQRAITTSTSNWASNGRISTVISSSRFASKTTAAHVRFNSTTNVPKPATRKALSESFLDGTSAVYVEEMFQAWRKNPAAVHASWDAFFRNTEAGATPGEAYMSPPTLHHGAAQPATPSAGVSLSDEDLKRRISDSMKVVLLVRAYQVRGHVVSNLDPLQMDVRTEPPELKPSRYGFTEADMERELFVGEGLISGFLSNNSRTTTLRALLQRLHETYCGTIGVEYMHIQDREQCDWIRERFEMPQKYTFSVEEKRRIAERLSWAGGFETFLGTKYKTHKRFGLDGGEVLVPGMKALIDRAADLGVSSMVIGMPHRGRLNVLANVVRKPLPQIFNEFNVGVSGAPGDEFIGSGDVKYHLGTSYDRPTVSGKTVHLSLVANPSHLEAVNPVVEGKTRAKQHYDGDTARERSMAVLLHGDAAFAGQGVVFETLHLSELPNYTTGGTVHIIVNNQIGFTTDPRSARSSLYCTDVAKTVGAPIFHVNGDDPEAVVHVCQLAAEWRARFKRDVVIDIVCYRRYGHNEIDQPQFTQPLMYQQIARQTPIMKKYAAQLVAQGTLSQSEVDAIESKVRNTYEQSYEAAKSYQPKVSEWLESRWEGFKGPNHPLARPKDTGVARPVLDRIGAHISTLPAGFHANKIIDKTFAEKRQMLAGTRPLDWATAEALAFGSLLLEGNHVRLSGQDVERGTFSHRHAVIHDQTNGKCYTPLATLPEKKADFIVCNSSLSEFAVLGFELGYAGESPNALVMWEAQFGDFANGAQVIVDQFISTGERKWLRQNGLVMLLPHGYDGQGPEHSSARLERYLQLCDSDPARPPAPEETETRGAQQANMQVVMCTTPANYYHVLRRQVHREFRKPLVALTSKWLLRWVDSFSPITEFAESTRFRRVIGEQHPQDLVPADQVRRVVFCSGQVYYYLLKTRQETKTRDVALMRVEQLAPFPFDLVAKEAAQYPNAEIVWCQEEPQNMGAWSFVQPHLITAVRKNPRYVGRAVSASPATGSVRLHHLQLYTFLAEVFSLPRSWVDSQLAATKDH